MTDPLRIPRRIGRNALVWVTGVLCIVYLPVFLGRIVFHRDPAHWNYPARFFVRSALLRGDSPFWNPDQGLGFAVLSNPLYGIFYPPNWLFLLVPAELVASMTTWQSLLHLLWGSAGMVLLARRLGASETGAGVAGLAWGLSGYTTTTWTAGLLLLANAWVPWCALGFVALARAIPQGGRALRGGIVRAAVPVGLALLCGEPFVAAMGTMLGVALGAVVAFTERGETAGLRAIVRRWGAATLLAIVMGGGVGAVVILPARAIAQTTHRGEPLSREEAEVGSLHPLRIIELVAANSMGHAASDYPAKPWVGDPLLDGSLLMHSVYMGASVLALALAALSRRQPQPLAFAGLAALALALGLGRHTPLHAVFRTVARPFAYMRYPEKHLVMLVALLALLAALGTTRIGERLALRRRTAVWAGVLALLAVASVPLFPPGWETYMLAGALWGVFTVSGALVAQTLAVRGRPWALVLVAVVSLDLAWAAMPHLSFATPALATRLPRGAARILQDYNTKGSPAPPRLYRAKTTESHLPRLVPVTSQQESEARSMETLIENTVTTFGVATVPGYDAAIPRTLRDVWGVGQKSGQSVMRLFGISYAILPIQDPGDPVERRKGLEPLFDPLPGTRLYRVPQALPRVYLAGRADVLPNDAALEGLLAPKIVAGEEVLLSPSPTARPLTGPGGAAGACVLETFENARLIARCRADREAMAVFVEQHDRGWRAEVDGQPTAIERANFLLRAVRLGPGDHTIVMSYQPPGLPVGAGLSVLSLLALASLALWRRRA